MKAQKAIALLLSTALSISTCLPLGNITALGAETGATAQVVEVQEEVSDSAESAESSEEEESSAAEETVSADEQEAASEETATEGTENAEENVTTQVEDDSNESAEETEAAVPAQEEEASEAADSTNSEEAGAAASEESAVPAADPVQNDNVENNTDITAPAQTETVKTDAQNSVDAPASADFSNAVEIKAGESHKVDITEEGGSVLYRFVPEETASYTFYSDENSGDPKAGLYDADKSLINTWDDENGNNFRIQIIFEKDETYYFEASVYSGTGSYTVHLVKNEFFAEQATDSYKTVFLNDEVTLEVRAFSSSTLSYQWYEDNNGEMIEGADSTAYTFTARKKSTYHCHVSDENGNNEDLYFHIFIDNRLKAYTLDEYGNETTLPNVYVTPNSSAELNVTVSADDMNGLTYEWRDNNYNLIEGADSTSYTIGSVTEPGSYYFEVSDQYGNAQGVTFSVYVQNNLKAYTLDKEGNQTDWISVDVAPKDTAELNVTVSADDMTGLTYEWSDENYDPIEGAGTTSCAIGPVTNNTTYHFRVSDTYGNTANVTFNVRVQNNLKAYTIDENGNQTDWSYVHVAPNSTVELNATVSADDMTGLTYEWRDGNSDLIEDAGTTSCTIGPVTKPGYYYFSVYDQYGNSQSITFSVSVQNHLEAYAVNESGDHTTWTDVFAAPNSTTELNVTVSADDMSELTYEWRDGNDNPVEGAGTTSCKIGPVTGFAQYHFYVSDQYGNSQYVTFDVHVLNHLDAYIADEEGVHSFWQTIYVALNGTAELNVTVSADDMTGLTYEWRDNNGNPVENAGTTSCTVGPVTNNKEYYFTVYDPYGNSASVEFSVRVENNLFAYVINEYGDKVSWATVNAAPNGFAELSVNVSADDMAHLTYEWRDNEGNPVEGAGTTSCTVGPVTQNKNYYFLVSDQYGNSDSIDFSVHVDNHLEAYFVNESGDHESWPTVYVAPNSYADLRVNVSADDMDNLTYEWTDTNGNPVEGAGTTSCTVGPVTNNKEYYFTVYDQYDNRRDIVFNVCPQNDLQAYTIDEDGNTNTYATIYVEPNGTADLSVIVSANDMDHLTYKWLDSEENPIEGADGTSCTVSPVTKSDYYYFIVSDPYYGNKCVEFYVRVKNNLTADSEGDNNRHITPGTSVTLKANVSANDMTNLKYAWYEGYGETLIQGANSTTYTTGSVLESKRYVFRVTDQYGNSADAYFYVEPDNNLKVYPEGNDSFDDEKTIYIAPGQSLELKVVSSANDPTNLSYQWYHKGSPINGAVSSSCKLNSVTSSSYYTCTVTDRFGNSRDAYFSVIIENHFTAYPEGVDPGDNYKEIFVAPGSSANLKVCVSADDPEGVTYQWYEGDDTPLSEAKAASYKVNSVTERHYYVCRVYDKYGNYDYADFTVSPLDVTGVQSIKAGDSPQVSVNEDAPYTLFKFTPTETSGYTLYSTGDGVDSYVEVFDGSYQKLFYNDDGGEENNFSLTKTFTAGTTYYIRARTYSDGLSGDFTMHLEKDSRKTQVLSANDMTLINGSNNYISVSGAQGTLNCRSSNSQVADVYDDGQIFAHKTGTTIITIYADGTDEYLPSESIKITVTVTDQTVDISTSSVSGLAARTYNGKAQTVTPVVKIGSTILRAGTDYTISYKNNTNAGKATIIFTGKGKYTGTRTSSFVILKAAQKISIKVSTASIAVGRTAKVTVTGNVGAKSYKSSLAAVASVNAAGTITAKKAGSTTITATAAATANYKAASKTVSIKVVPAATSSITAENLATGIKLTWKSVAGATGYKIYRGSKLIKTIKGGSIVTCTDTTANANGTTYTFRVVPTAPTGAGLARTLAVYRLARPTVSSARNTAARKMTVRWGKNAKATGYQIQYSTTRNFARGNKTVNIAKAATVSRVIGGLAKGKTYYVRIRTYKTVGKAKYWSAWSTAKIVKIKK